MKAQPNLGRKRPDGAESLAPGGDHAGDRPIHFPHRVGRQIIRAHPADSARLKGLRDTAGMLAGLALFLGDFLLTMLRTRIPLGEWLPVTNLFVLLGGTFGLALPEGALPSAGAAMERLALFGVATILAGALFFEEGDVHH